MIVESFRLAPHRFDDETAAKYVRVVPHVVLDDVAVVDAHVQANGPLLLEMAPRRDGHGVAATGRRLYHQKGIPEQAGLDDGPRQAVGRVAAVVFGRGQHGIAGAGRVDHGLAGAHGNAEGLFHQRVLAS